MESEIVLEEPEESNDEEPNDPSAKTKLVDITPVKIPSVHGFDLNGKQKSLNLEELFGFEEARRKAEESKYELLAAAIADEESFLAHRVFISNVDEYLGKYFAQVLSDLTYSSGTEVAEEEEEQEEEQEEETVVAGDKTLGQVRYEIVGTAAKESYIATEDVARVIKYEETEDYVREVMKCGYIIFDVTSADTGHVAQAMWTLQAVISELEKMKLAGPKSFRRSAEIHRFILISTVMTWALSKLPDPDDPETAFSEADFRRRKPHPHYRQHCSAEKQVVMAGKKWKPRLSTAVICAGVTYGGEQDSLQLLFKHAWLLQDLPLYSPGNNIVPLVSRQDLTKLVGSFLAQFPPSGKFVLAVEPSVTSLKTIVTLISRTLGSGHVTPVPREQAFLDQDLTQEVFEKLTVRLRMEPDLMAERVDFEPSFAEDARRQASEFVRDSDVRAIKIVLLGPPAAGKTRLARLLCRRYKLHYLHVGDVIKEALADMRAQISRLKEKERLKEEEGEKEAVEDEEEVEEEEEQEEVETLEDLQERLEELETNMALNDGRLDERFVNKLVGRRLESNACRNQGYVLDNYPKTRDQAVKLFGGASGEESGEDFEQPGEEEPAGNTRMPDHVIDLVAGDAMLAARVLQKQDSMRGFALRLANYRRMNSDDGNTVLDFFDQSEVHPHLIDLDQYDTDDQLEAAFTAVAAILGKPSVFALNKVELEAARAAEELRLAQEQAQLRRLEEERMRLEEHRLHEKREQWMKRWAELKEQEEERLMHDALPLRHYLVRYILPTLTKGLVEIARLRPADPVDYLADFLFSQNPEGRMFEPDFCTPHSELMMAIERQEADIFSAAHPDILTS